MNRKGASYDSAYTFSADQQETVKKIYQRYLPREESKKMPSEEEKKMEQLRKLDRSVTRAGTLAAVLVGLCGAAMHGSGIALIQGETMFVLGTAAAIAGLALLLASYPVCCFVMKKQRRRVEGQILRLCEELMK